MAVDPERDRRERRRARARTIRRRRVLGLIALAIVLAVLAASLAFTLGGGRNRATSATGATGTRPHPAPRRSKAEARAAARRKLEARADRATARFVRIGLPLYCGGRKGKYVALTFDDGPGPYTKRYAFKLLRRNGARATWFLVGEKVVLFPQLPREELEFGAVGDHTWTHVDLPRLSLPRVTKELASTQKAVERASGAQVRLFRPPYGAITPAIIRTARRLGMLTVQESIDSRDSQGAPWTGIIHRVLAMVRPGSIVLFHENRGQAIRALKRILPALHRRGFRTVSVPELLALDPPSVSRLRRGLNACL